MVWTPIVTADLDKISSTAFQETVIDKLKEHAKENPLPTLKAESGVMKVTPQFAEKALLRNAGNRKVTLNHVIDLAEAMKADAWKLAQPWIFDEDMMLVDGQQRALAVYLSGSTIETTVVVVPKQDDLFAYVDSGRPRDAASALYTAGLNGQSPAIAQAINVLWKHEHKQLSAFRQPRSRKMTNIEVIRYSREHPGIADVAHFVVGSFAKAASVVGSKGITVAFAYLIEQAHDRDVLTDFLGPLATGANLDEDSVILALRNRLLNAGDDEEKLSKPHRLALLIKAFNWSRNGKRVTRSGLYLKDNEKFPQIMTEVVAQAAE